MKMSCDVCVLLVAWTAITAHEGVVMPMRFITTQLMDYEGADSLLSHTNFRVDMSIRHQRACGSEMNKSKSEFTARSGALLRPRAYGSKYGASGRRPILAWLINRG